ncbi:tetratricopeptide repeat protein [Lacinutrix sp. 5H-3-7-4]|uniref:tetratricopeptide repeat protein n=1 Tax=Lacinutrix sp. (strain 5H-3-7-4) TaxID=983544 RepID=UPI00020A3518|nr:tetratricopeptide repeat protein [Lacinutrix sp. 5H-3-7-4]AEH00745.1 Tetratricopeptide TPR_1 repeat-containing protein [Lacinutrix sp. 5H-3-7-4]
MKNLITYIFVFVSIFSFAQEEENIKKLNKIKQTANNLIYNANDLVSEDDFVLAEMEYRKALSTQPTNTAGAYNLGHSYYKKGNFDEALYRNQQAVKNATNKTEKHRAYHNIGNILMQNKKCREAIDAYKNALRSDPTDDETRYNLGLAKECAKNQEPPQEEDDKKDDNQENEENKDKKEKEDEGENKDDKKDQGDDDKKEGDDKEDKGKPDEEKEKDGKGDDEKKEQQKPQQQPGQLSPQQIKNLLEAMNNQEQKVQEKINAEKAKGAKVQTEKDW